MLYNYIRRYAWLLSAISIFAMQKAHAANAGVLNNNYAGYNLTDTLSGKVVDSYSRAIAGVKVTIAESPQTIAQTDEEGNFSIVSNTGNTVLFNYPGYDVYQLSINGGTGVRIRLLANYLKNPDTIDVLYDRKRAENTLGSVASIYTNQITTTPAPIFQYSLAGRLPGLFTQQISGFRSAGISSSIQAAFLYNTASSFGSPAISDNSEIALSLRGQSPITIIDGVQREFSALDFENIESISVLKDGLSTILLGQFSSRGVILVTTKRPQAGAPRISFTAQTGVQQPLKLPESMPAHEYAYLYNEAALNVGGVAVYDTDDFNAYLNGTDPVGHPDIDWIKELTRKNSPIRRYNLNINGGSNKARYIVSLGYLNQEGMFKDYNLEGYNTKLQQNRYTINSNIEVNLSDNFTVALQMFGRIQDGNQPGGTTAALLSRTDLSMYTTPNNAYPIYNADNSFGGSTIYTNNLMSMLAQSGYIEDYARDVMFNLDMTYKLDRVVKGLWVKAKGNLLAGANNVITRSKRNAVYQTVVTPDGDVLYSRFGEQTDQANSYGLTSSSQFWYAQLSTGFDRQFGPNNISAMLFADQRLAYVSFDLPAKATNLAAKTAYNYSGKYFAEASVNYSGYDRFEPGKRFGWFYAGGLGWKISEESFIKDNASWINLLKIRGTYAKTGNANIGYFTYRGAFLRESGGYRFGTETRDALPLINQVENGGSTLTSVGATWEKADKFNAGLDLSILNNTIRFTADYYRDTYYDLMQQRGSSTLIVGTGYINENIGKNLYTGGEFSLTYQNHVRDFNYFITANASVEQTKILYQDEIQRRYKYNEHTGQPVNRPFGYVVTGIIQTTDEAAASPTFEGYRLQPGDLKYVDQNGDGIINDFDVVAIGTGKPRVYYGANLGFSYKGFDFSVLLQGVTNRVISLYYGVDQNKQINVNLRDRWTPTNTDAKWPRLTLGGNINNSPNFAYSNTFYQRSGDYFRIKNIDIGYNLPYKWVSKLGVSGLRIFANGFNVFTLSGVDDIDPEIYGGGYPNQRIISTGVNVKF